MKPQQIHKFRKRLLDWYRDSRRKLPWRETKDPYRIWVSEVMLQQTRVETVIPYFLRFLQRFPYLPSLARSDLQEVLKAWEGLGYYARARNLHRAARIVAAQYAGIVPQDPDHFGKLPGVGGYIRAAVASIAFDRPLAAVDGNVKRVLSRLMQIDAPVNRPSSHRSFESAAQLLLDSRHPGNFNQAMMELGAVTCTAGRPTCPGCPVRSACSAFREKVVDKYPVRIRSEPVPVYGIAVGVVCRNSRVLITRRKNEGLLGGLWEFPGGKIGPREDPATACIREIREEVNLHVEVRQHLARVRHAYTHFKIVMDVYRCRYLSGRVKLNGPVDYRWISVEEIDRFAFPKANHKFFPLLRKVACRAI
ncbi:MAG: A/G-specific adenine glycosylase [Deltaproteobacteria bacterium SG8_13]|nr:MAG: A/G-specific adenine glycosylase [Deltaproteobacteria bacterium SG8_13]